MSNLIFSLSRYYFPSSRSFLSLDSNLIFAILFFLFDYYYYYLIRFILIKGHGTTQELLEEV